MKNELSFEKVVKNNLETAIAIQKTLFPDEDATKNFIDSIYGVDHEKEKDQPYYIPNNEMTFWIVQLHDKPIGIVGLYVDRPYLEDAWMGWFGILPKYRGRGFAGQTFDFWIEASKEKGFKHARVYTDEIENADAVNFYEKMGMVKEKYYNPDDIHKFMDRAVIFSKSLTNEPVKLWNNKNIYLKQQELQEYLYLE